MEPAKNPRYEIPVMKSKSVLFIQHGDSDKPGLFGETLGDLGVSVHVLHPYRGDAVPEGLNGYAGLCIGGGAQGAYEQEKYPYLGQECALVKAAAADGRPVIGLCLGAQLMASALGGTVRPGLRREIGFYEVTLDPISHYDPLWRGLPQAFVATHWHGDVFDIPPGGMRLGSSALTLNQLFRYGHSLYGLQFHLEMTTDLLDEMIEDSREYLQESGVDPDFMRQRGRECLPVLRDTAATVFTRWAGML
jgi:GMP synthase-like glutamine amidotransferase